MHRRILTVPLAVAAVTMWLTAAAVAGADDSECPIILPAADRLQTEFDLVSPTWTPPWVAGQIRNASSRLHGLISPAAVDLRLRSEMLASQIDASDAYRPASPEQLAGDLAKARQQLTAARDYCAP